MKKKLHVLSALVIGLTSYSSAIAKIDLCFEIFPYVGLDAQMRHMTFEQGYGDNTLGHSCPQGNGYMGLRFNDYFAAEAGYEGAVTIRRLKTLGTGDVAAGMPIPETMSPAVYKSKISIQGPHIDLVGFYPLFNDYDGCPIEIMGSIGAAFLKATSERKTVSVANMPRSTVRTLIGRKTVLRTALGLQYMLNENLGIRGSFGWVNTSQLTISSNDNITSLYTPEVKPKNTAFCGIGLLWSF